MTDTADDKSHHVAPPPLPPVEPSSSPGAPLQFDTAEFSQAAGIGCSGCKQSITSEYYALNGVTLCVPCSAGVRGAKGSRLVRVARAATAGSIAAFAGGLLYFLVAYWFNIEFGLIAIAVGFAVGAAVRWGSYGRGGAGYQAMAMSLTYLAIVASLMAAGLVQIASARPDPDANAVQTSTSTLKAEAVSTPPARASLDAKASESDPGVLISLVMFIGLTLAMPFLAGIENILGIIIIGIGVYEAWKLNRRPHISGPHTVAGAGVPSLS